MNKPTIREEFEEKFLKTGDAIASIEGYKEEICDFFLNKIKEVVGGPDRQDGYREFNSNFTEEDMYWNMAEEGVLYKNNERQRILKEFGIIK